MTITHEQIDVLLEQCRAQIERLTATEGGPDERHQDARQMLSQAEDFVRTAENQAAAGETTTALRTIYAWVFPALERAGLFHESIKELERQIDQLFRQAGLRE